MPAKIVYTIHALYISSGVNHKRDNRRPVTVQTMRINSSFFIIAGLDMFDFPDQKP